MMSSSIQAFCWCVITAPPLLLTPWIDQVVLSLKVIICGSIYPVAVQESTAVMCFFSDFVVRTLTDFFPLTSMMAQGQNKLEFPPYSQGEVSILSYNEHFDEIAQSFLYFFFGGWTWYSWFFHSGG